jgi:hypothetical protein
MLLAMVPRLGKSGAQIESSLVLSFEFLRGCFKSPVASSKKLDPPQSPLKRGL